MIKKILLAENHSLKSLVRPYYHATLFMLRQLLLPWRKTAHVYRPNGIGDVLMCTPGLRAMKKANPRCRISFYTDFPDLVRGLPYIDEILPSNQHPPHKLYMMYEKFKSPRAHLSTLLGKTIGVRVIDVMPDCIADDRLVQKYKDMWKVFPHPHIIVQRRASAHTPNKNWPEDYWRTLLRSLLKTATIIEIGEPSPADDQAPNYLDLRGKTSIHELAAAIAAADILVAPVSGPVHIAAAVKTPAVVILGGYELPVNTAYPGNKILYTPIHCSPCWLRTPCPIDRECLQRITPDAVKNAVEETWHEILSARSREHDSMQSSGLRANVL